MLVDPRTRLPPRNISEYTVIYNLNVLFNYTNPQAPGVYGNATAMAEIKASFSFLSCKNQYLTCF